MSPITKITEHITRIRVPFYDIFTTVFLVKTDEGNLLFDTATYDSDVTDIILPALASLGVAAEDLSAVFLSHPHGDHAGGVPALLTANPAVTVYAGSEAVRETTAVPNLVTVADGDSLLGCLQVVAIPGHTKDSVGLLDTRTKTLLSGDGLQLYGIYGSGEWGANIRYPKEHIDALARIRDLKIDVIHPAHNYHPLGDVYEGREQILRALDACAAPLYLIRDMIRDNEDVSDEALTRAYNAMGNPPTIGKHVVAAVRRDLL